MNASEVSYLNILYKDDLVVAVDKPPGLLVHPSPRVRRDDPTRNLNCMALLRDQIGAWVYPVHRLDRATSGVLLFALNATAARELSVQFEQHQIEKKYLAVVRGVISPYGTVEKPLIEEGREVAANAFTAFKRIAEIEIDKPVSKFPTARFSMVELSPRTGRYHQLRKHLVHLRHPILGDTTYGDGRQNRFFAEYFGEKRLMLFAQSISFLLPDRSVNKNFLTVKAPLPKIFSHVLSIAKPE